MTGSAAGSASSNPSDASRGRVRRYLPADRPACLAVFDTNVPEFFRVEERAEFEAFLDDLPGPYLVLTDERSEVVGCGGWALHDDQATADLCWGMVRGDLHGRGWGRRLTAERVAAAEEQTGVRRIALQTSQHTVGFYERMGFQVESVERDGFAPGLDRVLMVRRPGPHTPMPNTSR